MICPICSRLMRHMVVKWSECEEFRTYDDKIYFCPSCGFMAEIVEEMEHELTK
jgi:hypothetical protein